MTIWGCRGKRKAMACAMTFQFVSAILFSRKKRQGDRESGFFIVPLVFVPLAFFCTFFAIEFRQFCNTKILEDSGSSQLSW